MTAAVDDTPDPEREPVRLDDLFADVVDVLAEVTATRRVQERHRDESGQS